MRTRLMHWALALWVLPRLILDARQRALFRRMRAFVGRLPTMLVAPLTVVLEDLTPDETDLFERDDTVRQLADVAALLERQSPLGLCLRRSLVRYHYLRRLGLPVTINFGARFKEGVADREMAGHAWLTYAGQPYYEADEYWRGFTVMLHYPTQA